MPVIRRPSVPPMPTRPTRGQPGNSFTDPMPRMPGGGDMPYPPNVDYRPVNKMPIRPGGLPMSNAPGGGIAATSPPGGGGALMPGAPNMPSAPLPVGAVYKKGGKVKKMASGGMTSKVSSASKRADGIAQRGKTKCKIC